MSKKKKPKNKKIDVSLEEDGELTQRRRTTKKGKLRASQDSDTIGEAIGGKKSKRKASKKKTAGGDVYDSEVDEDSELEPPTSRGRSKKRK